MIRAGAEIRHDRKLPDQLLFRKPTAILTQLSKKRKPLNALELPHQSRRKAGQRPCRSDERPDASPVGDRHVERPIIGAEKACWMESRTRNIGSDGIAGFNQRF